MNGNFLGIGADYACNASVQVLSSVCVSVSVCLCTCMCLEKKECMS